MIRLQSTSNKSSRSLEGCSFVLSFLQEEALHEIRRKVQEQTQIRTERIHLVTSRPGYLAYIFLCIFCLNEWMEHSEARHSSIRHIEIETYCVDWTTLNHQGTYIIVSFCSQCDAGSPSPVVPLLAEASGTSLAQLPHSANSCARQSLGRVRLRRLGLGELSCWERMLMASQRSQQRKPLNSHWLDRLVLQNMRNIEKSYDR